MKWFSAADTAPLAEAAPARARIRVLAVLMLGVLGILGLRASYLAITGDFQPREAQAAAPAPIRADLVDRNGVLLATTTRAFALTADPNLVWDARETAAGLRRVFPDLNQATLLGRLTDRSRRSVILRRGLSGEDRARVRALGLAGLTFAAEDRRSYPQGSLAGHVIGFTDRDLRPLAGAELGLQRVIAQHAGEEVRLSLDVRIQYAVEQELAAAARTSHALSGAAIVLDGRTGETLALASWPVIDPNTPTAAGDRAQRNNAVNARYEMGSTFKPFTVAMALDLGLTHTGERFDLMAPYAIDGRAITDLDPVRGQASLADILVHSSNRGTARIALRIGATRQRAYFERLGLLHAAPLQLVESAAPIAPRAQSRLDVASQSYGYAISVSPAALAVAYTVFANQGARVDTTLLARAADAPAVRTYPVFSARATADTLGMLREVVTRGTGRAANVPGLAIAGKTGTSERLNAGATYDEDRNLASFAAIFPATAPRYVIVLALDEPERTAATGGLTTGGAVAARPVGRIAERIAPFLGLRVERRAEQAPGPAAR